MIRLERIERGNEGEVLDLAREFHLDSRFSAEEFDEEHVRSYIDLHYLEGEIDPSAFGFIAYVNTDEGEKPAGIMSFFLTSKLMNADLIAFEEVMYVRDLFRGNGIGRELKKACESIAKDLGATDFFVNSVSGIASTQTNERLEEFGFNRLGTVFHKRL